MAQTGSVEHIHVAAHAGAAMAAKQEVRAIPGRGLEGDRYFTGIGRWSETPGGAREVTLVEAEELGNLLALDGIRLDPGATRRNVTTRGIRLNDLVGKRFTVGSVLCEGVRLCEPCEYLQGLIGQPILEPLVHRAGLRAVILSEGVIKVGDSVQEED
ncbi:MAG TPA: MOSC domain-containing protein [Solirubrobacterales bacterium]|nr:MOSC domain-containing protein [Solirubrobacterales bacterium]